MYDFFKKVFRLKTQELEAKLRPTSNCTYGGVGEIEASWFSDGTIEIELSLKHSGVPDSASLEYYANGTPIWSGSSKGGFLKSSERFSGGPVSIQVGSRAELRVDGELLYEGQFRPD